MKTIRIKFNLETLEDGESDEEVDVKDEVESLLSDVDNDWLFPNELVVKDETVQSHKNDDKSKDNTKHHHTENTTREDDYRSRNKVTNKATRRKNASQRKTKKKNEPKDCFQFGKKKVIRIKKSCIFNEETGESKRQNKEELNEEADATKDKQAKTAETLEDIAFKVCPTPDERKEKRRLMQLKRRQTMSQEKRDLLLAKQRQRRKDKLQKMRDDLKTQLKAELIPTTTAPTSLLDEDVASRLESEFNDRLTNLLTDTDLNNQISESELDKMVENKVRFESRMKQYLYRHARTAGMTEEEKKEISRLAHLRTLTKQLRETPEEREKRLRKQRERYRQSMAEKSHEEILKYRQMISRHHQKNKDKILQSQVKYADLSEEKKERVRAIQRERLKQETPEQRQKRLARYKRNQEKKIQLRKLQKEQGISQEEADVLLRVTRPDLYPDPTPNCTKGPTTGKAYVPRPHMYLKAKGRPRIFPEQILTATTQDPRLDDQNEQMLTNPSEFRTEVLEPQLAPENVCDTINLTDAVSTISFPVTETVEVVLEGTEIQLVPILMLSTTSVELQMQQRVALEVEVPVFEEEPSIFSPLTMSPCQGQFEQGDLHNLENVGGIVNEIEIREEEIPNESAPRPDVDSLTVDNEKIEESFPPPMDPVNLISETHEEEKKSRGGYKCNKPNVTEPRYVCELCGKQYYNQTYFNIHIESSHQLEKREFNCPDVSCGKIFWHSFHLWKHYDTVHGTGRSLKMIDPNRKAPTILQTSTICPYCNKNLATNRSVIRHIHDVHSTETGRKTEDIKFMCEQCPKKFKQKCTLDEHIRRVHLGINNKCDVCDRVFQSGVKLWRHKVDVHNMTNLDPSTVANVHQQECPYCQQKMFRGMKAHVLADHPDQADVYLTFLLSDEVVKAREEQRKTACRALYHEKYGPAAKKIVTCAICSQNFTRQYNLNVHVARCHSGDSNKTFPCDKCQQKFINVRGLIKHIMVHHATTFQERGIFFSMNQSNKSKVCKFCSQVLLDHNVYKLHIVSQHAEEFLNYFRESLELEKALPRCVYCGVQQKNEAGMKRHVRINHAEQAGLIKTVKTLKSRRKERKDKKLKEVESKTSPDPELLSTGPSQGEISDVNDLLIRKSSRVKKSLKYPGFVVDDYQNYAHKPTKTDIRTKFFKNKKTKIFDLETTKKVLALLMANDRNIIQQHSSDALLTCLPIVQLSSIKHFSNKL